MKQIFISFVFILYAFTIVEAQSNLVLNPGFEFSRDTCNPGGIGGFVLGQVDNWSDPNNNSSDYFSPESFDWSLGECRIFLSGTNPPLNGFGFEYPHSGLCYGGMVILDPAGSNFYEYIQGSLRSPLVAGKSYGIECYASIADQFPSCLSNLGFYFSDTQVAIMIGGKLPFLPQFENPASNMISTRNGWQKITGNYTAHGGEQYVCIGNFNDYALCTSVNCGEPSSDTGSYLFIDDVAVYDTAQIDTIRLCMNDSIQLGGLWRHDEGIYTDYVGGLPVKFYIETRPFSSDLTVIEKPFELGDSVRVSLVQLGGNDSGFGGYCFIWVKNDTIIDIPMYNINGCDSTIQYRCGWHMDIGNEFNDKFSWSIYPNPANDFIHIKLITTDPTKYSFTIIDVTGSAVMTDVLTKERIDISALKSGMYFIKLVNTKTGTMVGTQKLVKE